MNFTRNEIILMINGLNNIVDKISIMNTEYKRDLCIIIKKLDKELELRNLAKEGDRNANDK